MADEEHPGPEPSASRRGAPVLAAVLAVVVFAAMLGLRHGPSLDGVVGGAALLQTALLLARLVALRRTARVGTLSVEMHRFWVLWSVQAGVTYLAAGDDTAGSATVYVVTGLVFAVVVAAWWHRTSRGPGPSAPRTPTEPLPVVVDPHDAAT